MKRAEIDAIGNILATEEARIPSSGFVGAVMERIEEERRAPAPIPFPWKRAMPGIATAAGVFGWGVFEMVRQASAMTSSIAPPLHLSAAAAGGIEATGWVALPIVASMLAWRLSCRLVGQADLL